MLYCSFFEFFFLILLLCSFSPNVGRKYLCFLALCELLMGGFWFCWEKGCSQSPHFNLFSFQGQFKENTSPMISSEEFDDILMMIWWRLDDADTAQGPCNKMSIMGSTMQNVSISFNWHCCGFPSDCAGDMLPEYWCAPWECCELHLVDLSERAELPVAGSTRRVLHLWQMPRKWNAEPFCHYSIQRK